MVYLPRFTIKETTIRVDRWYTKSPWRLLESHLATYEADPWIPSHTFYWNRDRMKPAPTKNASRKKKQTLTSCDEKFGVYTSHMPRRAEMGPRKFYQPTKRSQNLQKLLFDGKVVSSRMILLMEEIRRSPVEVGSFSLFFKGCIHVRWWSPDFWTINGIMDMSWIWFVFGVIFFYGFDPRGNPPFFTPKVWHWGNMFFLFKLFLTTLSKSRMGSLVGYIMFEQRCVNFCLLSR